MRWHGKGHEPGTFRPSAFDSGQEFNPWQTDF